MEDKLTVTDESISNNPTDVPVVKRSPESRWLNRRLFDRSKDRFSSSRKCSSAFNQ